MRSFVLACGGFWGRRGALQHDGGLLAVMQCRLQQPADVGQAAHNVRCSCCTPTCKPSIDGLLTALCEGSPHSLTGLGTAAFFWHLRIQCMLYAV